MHEAKGEDEHAVSYISIRAILKHKELIHLFLRKAK